MCSQCDGKIVLAGSTNVNLSYDFIVARYNAEANLSYAKKVNDEALHSFSLKLSPNPVKDILHIEGLSSSSIKTISIIDVKGKVLQQTCQ